MGEGQNGLNWTCRRRIARAVEELGFARLCHSDHFTNSSIGGYGPRRTLPQVAPR